MSTELTDNVGLESVCAVNRSETIVNTFLMKTKFLSEKKISLEKNDLTLLLKRSNIHSFNKTVKETT